MITTKKIVLLITNPFESIYAWYATQMNIRKSNHSPYQFSDVTNGMNLELLLIHNVGIDKNSTISVSMYELS